MLARLIIGSILLTLPILAAAYETDQVSLRHRPLPDSETVINEHITQMMERARQKVLRTTGSHQSDSEIGWRLREAIYDENPMVTSVFGAPIEYWMIHSLMPQGYAFPVVDEKGQGRSIYRLYREQFEGPFDIFLPQAFNLAEKLTGEIVTPTFRAGDHLFGGDKLTHFFRLGFRYWKKSVWGKYPERGVRYGTSTENGYIGKMAIGVFSYGDLAANYSGYLFYRDLTGGSQPYFEIVRTHGSSEKMNRLDLKWVREFKLSDYISDDWDEYLNPNVYGEKLLKVIRKQLRQERSLFCNEYAIWQSEIKTSIPAPLDRSAYVDWNRAPAQFDPFELDKLCSAKETP